MIRSKQMKLTIKRHEPVVWISRVVLFKSTKPAETIRVPSGLIATSPAAVLFDLGHM